MHDILVLYYSHRGSVRALAERIARGIESVPGAQARLRTVPRVSTVCEATKPAFPMPERLTSSRPISKNASAWRWAARFASATWRHR
jgi:hypothetical protein